MSLEKLEKTYTTSESFYGEEYDAKSKEWINTSFNKKTPVQPSEYVGGHHTRYEEFETYHTRRVIKHLYVEKKRHLIS